MQTKTLTNLSATPLRRHLIFFISTVATFLFIGYHFGVFDEGMHIPFLKFMSNPTLYPGDAMIGLHNVYYSYFWYAFIPFLRIGWLEPVLFIVHFASIYASFWAIWELSDTLFHNPLTSLLSMAAFIVPHFSFTGFPIFEFAPLSRTFVLPFLLLAVNQFLKGRIPLAFFIAGLMYNIHVVSVNFILAMFGLACLLEIRRIGVVKILVGGGLFIVAALPVLIWKSTGSPVDFTLRPGWVDFLNLTLFRHIFAMLGNYPGTWVVTFGGFSSMVLFFIALRAEPPSETKPTARNFMLAGMIVVLVNIITVNFLPVTIIIQSQITRVGLWIMILAYLYFSDYLVRLYDEHSLSSRAFVILLAAFVLSPTPILVLFVWWVLRTWKRVSVVRVTALLTAVTIVATYVIVLNLGFWNPGIYPYGQNTPWVDVQKWAKTNTIQDARFITPPEKWAVQESDWRVHSERASVATLSELAVAAFQPDYEVEWKPRFELVAPGALALFNGDYFNNIAVTTRAYESLSSQDLLKASCKLDAQYIVSEKPYIYPDLKQVYENPGFVVYDVQGNNCK
jgi:hypothetical protein